jgi:hypothetical protein
MTTYTVHETKTARYAKMLDRARGIAPSHYETRFIVVDDAGEVSWDCATRASAERFAAALNAGDEAELDRLNEIAQQA